MTCASCANRIERKLNKLDGVTATVNYATEKATVEFDAGAVEPEQLRRRGRGGRLPAPRCPSARAAAPADDGRGDRRARAAAHAAARLAAARPDRVRCISMIPALQFDNWQWLVLQLATPVILWGAWPFHRAAWANLRHGTATMDTLISLGDARPRWLWSLYALFLGDAGMPGMTMSFELIPEGSGEDAHLPRGRRGRDRVPARRPLLRGARQAPRRRGAQRRCSSSAPRTSPILDADGTERRVPIEQLAASATASSSARARRSPPTASSRRARAPSTSRC